MNRQNKILGGDFLRAKIRNSSFVLALVVVLLLSISLPLWAAELIILHTNDVHSRLESHVPSGAEEEQGGRVRLASVVDEVRGYYGEEKVILLDAGDSIHGTNIDNLFGGLPSIEVMSAMGYNAFTLGNHEFNYGQEVLGERILDAEFPTLAANVSREDGSLFGGYSALIQEFNGIKVGIIGVVPQDTPIVTHPNNVIGLTFHDPIEVVKQVAKVVRPQVDILMALTHIGYSVDLELARAVPELDVIVGGHSHTKLEEAVVENGVIIVQNHEYANNLGFLRLEIEDKKIVGYDSMLIPITADEPKNPKVQAVVDKWDALLQERLGQVVGSTDIAWNGEREFVRVQETNLGNLVADVIRNTVDADIALTNGGGIRASMHPGEVSVADIYSVLPFDNTLAVVELRGMDIIEALEHSVRLLPAQNGGFLQVSGISFEVMPDAIPGARVINVKVNGEPISMSRYYTVATNDFLAAGGDGYETFKNGKLVADTGIMLRDVMVDYFLANPEIKTPAEGRIIIVK